MNMNQILPCGLPEKYTEDAKAFEQRMYDRFCAIFLHGARIHKMDETNELRYSTLFWLLRDSPKNDDFVAKLAIVGNQMMRRIASKNANEVSERFVSNIALAICKIENSSMAYAWNGNIKIALKKFILNQVAYLLLKGDLSNRTIDVLLCSKLIRENAAFRKLIRLSPMDESDEEDWDEEGALVIPQQGYQSTPAVHASTSAAAQTPAIVPLFSNIEPQQILPENFNYKSTEGQLNHVLARYFGFKGATKAKDKKLGDGTWSTYAFFDTVKFTVAHNVTDEFIGEYVVEYCSKRNACIAAYFAKEFNFPKDIQDSKVKQAWNKPVPIRQRNASMYTRMH